MSRIVPVSLLTLALLGAGGASPAAAAAPAPSIAWATVNICSPGSTGMRVGVLGDGRARRAYARFTAQWWSPVEKGWIPVAGSSSSPWVEVGSTVFASRQNGWTFAFAPTTPGSNYIVRGLATVQWRAGGSVVRQRTLVTRGGLAGVAGGTSRASCTLG